MKFYYMIREDGSRVEIPEADYEATKKLNPAWKTESVYDTEAGLSKAADEEPVDDETCDIEPEVPAEPEFNPLACPLCDFVAKTERSLKTHKTKNHS